ncbi:uncharacterized protein LOC9646059 [Selaginella moellendorffii]|uniref:uncharacterized protein LOC9646059 n=1 Tax=Selaginella moellendorffii TaxID=88036 RepID=UPI000D1C2441|nr:uncharacterized protein LOC9646059 [Selaginella moellendorffii]|eukprot:XP_002969761.2 uncharacterized protein LOC9646059 [Selaginella moellendorffii]
MDENVAPLAVNPRAAHPVPKNVFKRLYSGFKGGDPKIRKHGSTKEEEIDKTPLKATRGRQVSSKFSGVLLSRSTKKYDSQRQCLAKKFSFKTPSTNQQFVTSERGAESKPSVKTPASVRLARSKLESAKYWLSLVSVAEKAGKHAVSVGLFRLATDCGAKPIADIQKGLASYTARYNLNSTPADSHLEVSTSLKVEEHVPDVQSDSQHPAINTDADEGKAVKEVKAMENVGDEECSRVSVIDKLNPEDDATSEVINGVIHTTDAHETGATSKLDAQKSPPKPSAEVIAPRRTPRRACAIRAIQRIEESNKKQPRRKQSESKAGETSNEAPELDVEKMDVDALMEEVVSCMMTGSGNQEVLSTSKPRLRSSCKKQAKVPARCAISPNQAQDKKAGNGNKEFQVVNESSKTSDHNEVGKENAPKVTTSRTLFETPTKKSIAVEPVPGSTETRKSARIRSIGKSAGKCA